MNPLLLFTALPYLALGAMDHRCHRTQRRVPLVESALHGLIFVSVLAFTLGALILNTRMISASLALLLVCGAADEFGFHRDLSAHEASLHAKSHWALFAYVATVLALGRQPAWSTF